MEKPFSAYDGAEPYVFVCYSHEDAEVVYPELAWLRDQGINLWYDEGIPAGRNWREVVGDSLLGARHLLFYISDRSLRSDHCNREVGLALDEGKDIVPVYLRSVELTSDLKIGLNRVQALDREHARTLSATPCRGVARRGRSESCFSPQRRCAVDARHIRHRRAAVHQP